MRDVLVFFNEKNVLNPPITLSVDRIKSEFTTLRRHNKSIHIGICRCSDRSLFNTTTIQHLGALTLNEFQKISLDYEITPSFNESRKSLTIVDEILTETNSHKSSSKTKLIYEQQNKPLISKRSMSPNRDSGFIETDGTNTSMLTDRSVISTYNKRRSKSSLEKSEIESMDTHKSLDSLHQSVTKIMNITDDQSNIISGKQSSLIYSHPTFDNNRPAQRDLPTQTVTDGCFIYRRQVIKQANSDEEKVALIVRGREIAHEAANTPTLLSSMPNYTRDEIRELYGELDRKTRRLQEDEYTLHSPMINNTSNEKLQWKLASTTKSKMTDECPLPKFRLDQTPENDESLLMAAYLTTGLSNPRTKTDAPVDNLHTVMMNASAKVNEWATNNEIYLTPIDKEIIRGSFRTAISDRSTVSPSPLLLDVQFNLKQLAGTPTGGNDRPTFLEGIQQQTTSNSNQPFSNRETRGSIRRQKQMTDTYSSSPDSGDIVLETTPSTPGSCGMYLEPYMRLGYDLPSLDHHIRDSSWQHADNDNTEGSVTPMKNISPIESPTTPQIDTNILPSRARTSQIIDTDSLIDLDDGTTTSYHTAKESRLDNGRQSTYSMESDNTTSTLHQSITRDDIINHITSPDGSFYYDALPSPSQANQQLTSSSDKQNILIDNLTNLLEEIETFNRTNRPLLTTMDEEKSRLPAEEEEEEDESTHNIDCIVSIVEDIHHYNQIHIMDNLLFIYDEQPDSPNDNLVEDVDSTNQRSSCVNNLLFVYDDAITPTDDNDLKHIGHDSDEWSYDNLLSDQDEEVKTDHLGTIIHEALVARFQKSIKFKSTDESTVDTDNLGTIVHEALAARFQKPITEEIPTEGFEESVVDTDNLGPIVHEALAARFQKPITVRLEHEIPTVKFDEPTAETSNQDATIDETLTVSFEESTDKIPTAEFEEPIAETDNLGTIIHEALAARFQKLITVKLEDEIPIGRSDEPISEKDNPDTTTEETFMVIFEKSTDDFEKPFNEFDHKYFEKASDDTHTLETLMYEIESSPKQPTISKESDLPPVSNLSQIVSDSLLTSSNYYQHETKNSTIHLNITQQPLFDEEVFEEYGYRRTTTDSESDDIVDKFEELYQRYSTSLDQYRTTTDTIDNEINEFEKDFTQQMLTPTSDTTSEELVTTIELQDKSITNTDDFCSILTVRRQGNLIGKYGFNFEELIDGKIIVSQILDLNYCPYLNIGDEIVSINNNRSVQTFKQCQLLFDSLWNNHCENVQITVIKSSNIPIISSK